MLDTLKLHPTGVPIYVQIRDQLLRAIGDGSLKPGAQMPTMRQIAVALKIDLNTVRHAYDALARTGAIDVQPGRGTFVSDTPPARDPGERQSALNDLAHRTIAAASAEGLDVISLAEHIIRLLQQGETGP